MVAVNVRPDCWTPVFTLREVTARMLGAETPRALLAVTVILPLAVPAVAKIPEVEEVPVHPGGRVQV